MAEDLRLRAMFDDQASGALGRLAALFRNFSRDARVREQREELQAFGNALPRIGHELSYVVNPALAQFGIVTGSVVGSLIGLTNAVSRAARESSELHYFAEEIGFTSKQLKEFEVAASAVNIPAEAAGRGMQQFGDKLFQMRNRTQAANEMLATFRLHGIGPLFETLQRDAERGDNEGALQHAITAIDELRKRRDPQTAGILSQMLFGDPRFARMSPEEMKRLLREIGPIMVMNAEAAREFTLQSVKMNVEWSNFQQTVSSILVGPLTEVMHSLTEAMKDKDIQGGMVLFVKELGKALVWLADQFKLVKPAFEYLDQLGDKFNKLMDLSRRAGREGILNVLNEQAGEALGSRRKYDQPGMSDRLKAAQSVQQQFQSQFDEPTVGPTFQEWLHPEMPGPTNAEAPRFQQLLLGGTPSAPMTAPPLGQGIGESTAPGTVKGAPGTAPLTIGEMRRRQQEQQQRWQQERLQQPAAAPPAAAPQQPAALPPIAQQWLLPGASATVPAAPAPAAPAPAEAPPVNAAPLAPTEPAGDATTPASPAPAQAPPPSAQPVTVGESIRRRQQLQQQREQEQQPAPSDRERERQKQIPPQTRSISPIGFTPAMGGLALPSGLQPRAGSMFGDDNLTTGSLGPAGYAGPGAGTGGGYSGGGGSIGGVGGEQSSQPQVDSPPLVPASPGNDDGSAVPPDVLAGAENLLRKGGGSTELQGFMAKHGYPKSGAWCGQFTASVVTAAGGKPPKDAAVASNWMRWGQHIDPQDVQPGDIAVRKRSRYGGMAVPGQPGSHVGIVHGADVEGGTFQLTGGNQGRPIVQHGLGEYEFRRPRQGEQLAAQGNGQVNTGPASDLPKGSGAGQATYEKMLQAFQGSSVVGQVPPDAARFGIKTGSAEEWARFGTAVAKSESSFNPRTKNTSDPGGSFGILQYAHNQVPGGNAYDVDASIKAFVRDTEKSAEAGSLRKGILGRRFSTIGRHPERTQRNLADYEAPENAPVTRPTDVAKLDPPRQNTPVTRAPDLEMSDMSAGRRAPGWNVAAMGGGGDLLQRELTAASPTNISGNIGVKVDVNAPKGTKVSANADGPFKKVELNRTDQMSNAEDYSMVP